MSYDNKEEDSFGFKLKLKVASFLIKLSIVLAVPLLVTFLANLCFDLTKEERIEIFLIILLSMIIAWLISKWGGGGGKDDFIPPSVMG